MLGGTCRKATSSCCCVSSAMVVTMLGYGLLLIPCCLFVWVLQYLFAMGRNSRFVYFGF